MTTRPNFVQGFMFRVARRPELSGDLGKDAFFNTVKPKSIKLRFVALSLAALSGGCTSGPSAPMRPVAMAPEMNADDPAFGCPWLDAERYHAPVKVQGSSGMPPMPHIPFVPGCAIVRFRVAADGSVYKVALRAANPLDDGPTALAAVQQMRFQPVQRPETYFVLRLSMKRDTTGHISVSTDTRSSLAFLENDW